MSVAPRGRVEVSSLSGSNARAREARAGRRRSGGSAEALRAAAALRRVRVGLLGLGQVGQAVVRAVAASEPVVRARGLSFEITGALVRDSSRRRDCPGVPHITADAEEFLRGRYDLVIEALGGIEPARTLITRLLSRGVPVVTANKNVLAAHGDALAALASRHRAALRFEAAVVAGVPFLGALERRPLVSSFRRLAAILNGTSNFILTAIACEGISFDAALHRAQALGFCEPDPSFDIDGRDALDKLLVLLRLMNVPVARDAIEVRSICSVERDDAETARALGGCLKPVACAEHCGDGIAAFVGPAFVPSGHPLAAVGGSLNGFCLDGAYVDRLFYSGPGAGPAVTAATLLDDAIEVVRGVTHSAGSGSMVRSVAPSTGWFVRMKFDHGSDVERSQVSAVLGQSGIRVVRLYGGDAPGARTAGFLTGCCAGTDLETALRGLRGHAASRPQAWEMFRIVPGGEDWDA